MDGVARAASARGGAAELANDRIERAHVVTGAAVRLRQGRRRMGESRMAPTINAIKESASCIVTVACQYCQPLKSPLGMVVPRACTGFDGPPTMPLPGPIG